MHLASTQTKKENNAAGMAMIYSDALQLLNNDEYWKETLKSKKYEDDIVFLGDFNHNPYIRQGPKEDGIHSLLTNDNKTANPEFINLVKKDRKYTRMNYSFSSLIDHIYVSSGMQKYLVQDRAVIYRPEGGENCENYTPWREVYSDHFPVYFEVLIKKDK